jgi:predicted enzyme related to lactoylglutathione lyase
MPMAGGEYATVVTTPVDEQTQMPTEPGAINGGMMQRDDLTPAPVITIESAGGTTVTPRTAIPGMGAFAYFKDPEANVLGLWETIA